LISRQAIIINCDAVTAKYYALLKSKLKAAGRPVPENDIWIAATAMQNKITVATRDVHFSYFEGITIERW
jgi:tRNA(fMet)-specific endonuclease VapC